MNPFIAESLQRDLILASRSPRRIALMRGLDFVFKVEPALIATDKRMLDSDPHELPVRLAVAKAEQVSAKFPHALVLGADTVVLLDGKVYGKPVDADQAVCFLKNLSGRDHQVITGIAVRRKSDGLTLEDKETTRVRFKELDVDEINAYIGCGEWKDKAGGYAIQGLASCFITSIEGCFFNVVGLPVARLFALLRKAGKLS